MFDGFFCHNLEYNAYTEFITAMFEKTDLFISQGKDLLESLSKKSGLLVYGGNIRKSINEDYKSVIETWMRQKFEDRVKE